MNFKVATPYLYILLAFMQAGLTSGIIYGWPALEGVFIKQGNYRSHCKETDTKNPCDAQLDFYDLIFTVGVFVNNAAPLLAGIFLDFFGPKWTNLVSAGLFFVGCGLFAVPVDLMKVPAFGLLGFAGPGIYCSIMHLCNLFPGHQSSVLSFFSGTFSASSFIFKVFALIYKPVRWRDLGSIFVEYIALLAPLFILGAFIWPNKPFEPPGQKTLAEAGAESESTQLLRPTEKKKDIGPSLYNASYKKQFKAPIYWCTVAWLALENLNISVYLGTVQERYKNDSDMSTVFNLIWSFGWVTIPAFGIMMDKKGVSFSMFMTSLCLLCFSILKCLPIENLQYVSFVLVSGANVGMWGIFYSYLSQKFGFDNYGKLLGVSSVTVASIGALQYPLAYATAHTLNGNFLYMDSLLGLTSSVALLASFYLWRKDVPKKKKKMVEYFPINTSQ